ncbi:MAG: M15 family metallopeptidase [Clostridiales bacterium]
MFIVNFYNKNLLSHSEGFLNTNINNILDSEEVNYRYNAHNPYSIDLKKITLNKVGLKDDSFADYAFIEKNITDSIKLINKNNSLNSKYIPKDLSTIDSKFTTGSLKIRKIVLGHITKLFEEANKDNINTLKINSAYRSYDLQNTLFNNKLAQQKKIYSDNKEAYNKASQVVAIPGTSEHQAGIALDLSTKSLNYTLVEDFSNTPEGNWLDDNCWKFGFVVRYPKSKTNITTIIYEPWHIRFIALPHSEIMFKNKLCLEEYIDFIKNTKLYSFKAFDNKDYKIFYYNRLDPNTHGIDIQKSKISDITKLNTDEFIITVSF